MQADQRKTRQVVVEENPSAPTIFVMALGAILALLALMYIVVSMAIDATGPKAFSARFRSLVATLANDLCVFSFEGKFGFSVMVKGGLAPIGRRVTCGTILPGRSFMRVSQLMA